MLSLFTAVSPCASSPCVHGGVCDGDSKMYVCKCPQAFFGRRCEYGETAEAVTLSYVLVAAIKNYFRPELCNHSKGLINLIKQQTIYSFTFINYYDSLKSIMTRC